MIYVLYGQPGAGKTVLSDRLCSHIRYTPSGCDPVVIDGDRFRRIFNHTDYSTKGRERNIRAANAVATHVNQVDNRDVIMALVNPYKYLRTELKANNSLSVKQVLLTTTRDLRLEHHVTGFEVGTPDASLNTDQEVGITWEKLKGLLEV